MPGPVSDMYKGPQTEDVSADQISKIASNIDRWIQTLEEIKTSFKQNMPLMSRGQAEKIFGIGVVEKIEKLDNLLWEAM